MAKELTRGIYRKAGKKDWYFYHENRVNYKGFGDRYDGSRVHLSVALANPEWFSGWHHEVSNLSIPGEFI